MRRWFPNTIATKIALTCVLSLLVFQLASVGLLYFEGLPTDGPKRLLLARIVDIVEIIEAAPPQQRPTIIASLDRPNLNIALRDSKLADLPVEDGFVFQARRRMLQASFGDPQRPLILGRLARSTDGRGGAAAPQADLVLAEIGLADGQWLLFATPDDIATGRTVGQFAMRTGLFCLVIGLLSCWAASRLAAPIADFGRAAERLGIDPDAPLLAERGPHELRAATRAFNRMQERLRRFVEDRTQMLAAMSHDLRTPLARLRLRAEFVEDAETQRKMLADLDEMAAMIRSTLTFARDDMQREPTTLVDLGVLVEDICEDAADAGGAVCFSGAREVEVSCRPAAIRRAVANLVDNALKYGGLADVRLVREPERVLITVDDEGPGIPADEQEKVFAPFYRIEKSRSRDTGGVGLGLAVARTIAREHGGDVTLSNRQTAGLSVVLELPQREAVGAL